MSLRDFSRAGLGVTLVLWTREEQEKGKEPTS